MRSRRFNGNRPLQRKPRLSRWPEASEAGRRMSARRRRQGTVAALRHVLHGGKQTDPRMHAIFIYRARWCRKARFGECSDWHCNVFFVTLDRIMHCGAAFRAEMKCNSASLVADADVRRGFADDLNSMLGEPCLRAEHASSSALAGQAVTDGDTYRLFAHREVKLTTTTRRRTKRHTWWKGKFFCCLTSKLSGAPPRGPSRCQSI
jgi:hypothetical protein